MVHIETQKVKVLRANQKNAKLCAPEGSGYLHGRTGHLPRRTEQTLYVSLQTLVGGWECIY